MKLFILTYLFSIATFAESMITKVHSIIPIPGQEHAILRLNNGRAVFVRNQNNIKNNFIEGSQIKLEVNSDNFLKSLQVLNASRETKDFFPERANYTPTVLPDLDEAKIIFNRLNSYYLRASECYNRAHVWAYEEFTKHQLFSMKTFVFFTASYINKFRFNWWFHVAPMVYVKEGNEIIQRVLDYRYTSAPLKIKEWTDMFVFNRRPCKITTKFSEYDVNPQTEECYLINTSMYYWQPYDTSNEETQGIYKNSFPQSEIQAAYTEAFEEIL